MPNDFGFKAMNAIHRGMLKISGGKLGWEVQHMPALELTTVGRKTGQRRTVMLTSPVQEGPTIVLVGSRGGDDRHPAWFLNLQANPEVEVSWKGEPMRRMRARIADPEERARLWPLVTADHKQYAGYQTKTQRELPVVLLEPAG